jgi:polyisoprenoid-binding protein YceI
VGIGLPKLAVRTRSGRTKTMKTMKKKLLSGAVLTLSTLTIAAGPEAMVWNIDKPHTGVSFEVKHFFTPVRGQFEEFDVELTYDRESPEHSTVRVSIPVAAVNTANEKRNAHLLSEDFFEADAHPYIKFVSESVEQVSETQLLVRGPLEIKGVVRQIELPVTILGVMDVPGEMQEMLGGVEQIASFETSLSLDRRDFGVGVGSWAATAVVGKNVNISIAVEANR